MKKFTSLLFVVVMCLAMVFTLCACKDPINNPTDYVAKTHLNLNSSRARMEVGAGSTGVHMYIDGDTTHFNVPSDMLSQFPTGVLKARYLGVDTPESTGAIEPWGKHASNFTKSKLSTATSIILESNSATWETDSTSSGRTLTWVWYQPSVGAEYRLLNLELLQEGLAKRKDVDGSPYEDVNGAANRQANAQALRLHGTERDPLYWYDGAQEVDLKELRINMEKYEGQKVGFTGTIALADNSQGLYVQEWNEIDQRYYGIYVYYGFQLNAGHQYLVAGNEIHFIGTVTNFNGSWQVSDLKYFSSGWGGQEEAEQRGSFRVVSENNEVVYTELTGTAYHSDVTIDIDAEGTQKSYKYYELALGTAVTFKNITVTDTYQTKEDFYYTKKNGTEGEFELPEEISLTCATADGKEVEVRTGLFYDPDGLIDDQYIFQYPADYLEILSETEKAKLPRIILESYFANKVINVNGFVEYFKWQDQPGKYQIEVGDMGQIEFVSAQ